MRKLFRAFTTVYFLVIASLYLVAYGGFVLLWGRIVKLLRGEKASKRYVLNEVRKFGIRAFSWLMSKVEVDGTENIPDEPVLVTANHQSLMDIPLILGYVKRGGFIAKRELEKVPGISWFIKYMGGVFIDRNNPRQIASEVKKVLRGMRNGNTYIVFPEGTRTEDGSVGEFKKGSLVLAMKTGVKVLPVAIWGTMFLVPKDSLLFDPGKVYLKILPPVDPKEFDKEENLIKAVRDRITSAVEELRKKDLLERSLK